MSEESWRGPKGSRGRTNGGYSGVARARPGTTFPLENVRPESDPVTRVRKTDERPVVTVIVGVVGVVVGALLAWVLAQRRSQALRDDVAAARGEVAVRDAQLAAAQGDLARIQLEHEAAIAGLEATFENLSNRVLAAQMDSFARSQQDVQRERDEKLGLTIQPLTAILSQYERNLAEFGREHVVALEDVKKRAADLLEAQRRTQEETSRLNQILGRSDQRGRWGEI